MQRLLRILIPPALAAVAVVSLAQQQPPPQQKYFYHYEWTRGAHLTPGEWARGREIESARARLPAPPPGDVWREIDRNYVLATLADHTIVRVIAAPR